MEDEDVPRGIGSRMGTLKGLLGGGSVFVVPPFQRAYSWGEDQVERLVEDTSEACDENQPYYFLGTLVLQRSPQGELLVIDGHQRLMTLTLMIAHLRDSAGDAALSAQLQALIAPDGPGAPARLLVRQADQELVRRTVQTPGRLHELANDRKLPSRSQRRLGEAAKVVVDHLDATEPAARADLARFLCQRVTFNVIEADDTVAAGMLFRVLNQRGLAMSISSLIKSQLLARGGVERSAADVLSDRWDELEERLGDTEFESLLRLIPTIISGDPRHKEGDLGLFYGPDFSPSAAGRLITEDFWVFAQAYQNIARAKIAGAGPHGMEVRRTVHCLQMNRERQWLAPAIAFVAHGAGDPDALLLFFKRLDQLAFGRILGAVPHARMMSRFARAIAVGSDPERLFGPRGELHLTPAERAKLIEKINEPMPSNEHRRRAIAFRTNAAMPEGGEALLCERTLATLEHVKPIADTPGWLKKFPPGREDLTHLLGNFAILTQDQNDRAANLDYAHKREIYFDPAYPLRALTRNLQKYSDWNELQLRRRHEELVVILCTDLGLA